MDTQETLHTGAVHASGLMTQIGLPGIQRPHRLKDSPRDRHRDRQGFDAMSDAIDGA